jgi:CheY-like chemotaxis protein
MKSRPTSNFQLVLVDNDDNDVFFMERALRKAGLEVPITRLADGQHAIDYFSRLENGARPDLVLLDVQMPRRNGFEVLDWLRQHPSYQELPVMMLTSSDDPIDLRRAQSLGADRFLTKEATCRDVIEVLEQLLTRAAEDGAQTPPQTAKK